MADKIFSQSQVPIRRTVDLLPEIFKTETNAKFMAGVVDPLIQPGVLEKTVGYIGRRYGKTFNNKDVYLDTDPTLRSRYQLEPGVVVKKNDKTEKFYDYIDFKNQLRFFGNLNERDDLITEQDHYSWDPPICWDKFVNFREYYWLPFGPPNVKVSGQALKVTSQYRVRLGELNSWILFPDGLTNNPTITLYRGQKYTFNINAPKNNFFIRSSIDQGNSSNYNKGVTNQGTDNGKLIFEVPVDAPDILYYQSEQEPSRVGKILIDSIEGNTKIDVTKEILGKLSYTTGDGVPISNGMVLEFIGQTMPTKYSEGRWIVEGVGKGIRLVEFASLVPPSVNADTPEVLFDNSGFDTEPFDDATAYPSAKDYVTINRASKDRNPWSRYNRWFHRDVIETAHKINGTSADLSENLRAKRPIIEFDSDILLYNHGWRAKADVDFVDTFTKDVFSTIEGSIGYNVDGEFLFDGARLLVVADEDEWANNKIYEVKFITYRNNKQITLKEVSDSAPVLGDCVLVKRGKSNAGIMFHYTGTTWIKSQPKTKVNQNPLFDAVDADGISFSDSVKYPVSSFAGTSLLSYKKGNSVSDTELGFSLSYLNIDNVGDIQFEYNWETEKITWQEGQELKQAKVSDGYYIINGLEGFIFKNGWRITDKKFLQPIIDTVTVEENTDTIVFKTCEWKEDKKEKIIFFLNGYLLSSVYQRIALDTFKFDRKFNVGDILTIKVFSDMTPDLGYYEIPLGLEKNPLNNDISSFTFGQAADHVSTMIEVYDEFKGSFPGVSNLRDIDEFQKNGRRFLKHSGLAPLPILMLCDKEINLIKSIQYAKKSYTEFKNKFLNLAYETYRDQDPIDFVDDIIQQLSDSLTAKDSFSDSDMIGSGAFTKIEYQVEDSGIKTFALSEKFDLSTLTRRAVYLYINRQQLLVNIDYEFDKNFGFVTIKKHLNEGDVIEIREYLSTATNFIPATPTSLGMYKKYTPMVFTDDTYQIPTDVIQGHDGSITVAFNDIRDEILLELEKRIYNNIKKEYNPNLVDIDKIFGGYYGNSVYNKPELDNIINREFLKWASNANIDYVTNSFIDTENSFTYTYSKMSDPTQTRSLPGWWRGVYQWFYDTDRPHRCPWEMLGFSEKPDWWEAEYGAAPYTSGNLILWEDIRDGIIRKGERQGQYDRYSRPTIMSHLPVDGDGNLLSPLDSKLARDFSLVNNQGDFNLGDLSPAEYAWRSSSEYPFAIMIALALLRPFESINKFVDLNLIKQNKIGQYVTTNNSVLTLDSIKIPVAGEAQTTGFVNWAMDYLRSKSLTNVVLRDKLENIDVFISSRIGGFVDQAQQKYLLDSKNPKSTSSNIFIPNENFDIFFNVSTPISTVAYSGVIIEKVNKGWRITGYDDQDPYFNYFQAISTQTDALVSVGGVSESFVDWDSNKFYINGQTVRYQGAYYRVLSSHTSTTTFDKNLFRQMSRLPQVGSVDAFKRNNFNKLVVQRLGYGTVLTSIQQVVDFLLGYEQYLISIGLSFDQYDPSTQTAKDWFTSAKEFMFWTKHNWAEGSLLTLSPAADKLEINIGVGVADNLLDIFYEYQIYKSDGTVLSPNFINVNREIQKISISTTGIVDGIYFIKINFVLKEHVVTFSDRTVFNDVIYDKTTGYRQDRIKVRGFRTTDWDGDYTSPGFLFDNVNIQEWTPFTDYKLGDIVSYREFFWTSSKSQSGALEFDAANWTRLDLIPKKGLVPNFDYKINQFDDYFDLDADGVGSSQRDLSRHSIGYQQRTYLQNLAEDEVSQFKIYQGFIREKGTANSIVKVFDKLSRSNDKETISLNEEWAFKVGELGGLDQRTEVEFLLNRSKFQLNPQPIIIASGQEADQGDKYIRLRKPDFTIAPTEFTENINPNFESPVTGRSAGYVRLDQIEFITKEYNDILTFNIDTIKKGNHVWLTFDGPSWKVLRYDTSSSRIAPITRYVIDNNLVELEAPKEVILESTNRVVIGLNGRHNFAVDDIIGVQKLDNLNGFYKVVGIGIHYIIIQVPEGTAEPEFVPGSQIYIKYFESSRFANYRHLDLAKVAKLPSGSKLWIDHDAANHWEVIEKSKQYSVSENIDLGLVAPGGLGEDVIFLESLKQAITTVVDSIDGGRFVVVYNTTGSTLEPDQIISLPSELSVNLSNKFASTFAASPDDKWLAVGSPEIGNVPSKFVGSFATNTAYTAGDIVEYNGSLWKALENISSDSSIDIGSQRWEIVNILPIDTTGTNLNFSGQGIVTLYERGSVNDIAVDYNSVLPYPKGTVVTFQNRQYVAIRDVPADNAPPNGVYWSVATGRWNEKITILSPLPASAEHFGNKVELSGSNGEYYLAVSASGALNGLGSVYLFKYTELTGWQHLSANNYAGVFDVSKTYQKHAVVWYDNIFWKANDLIVPMGSAPSTTNLSWSRLDDAVTRNFLPSRPATTSNALEGIENGEKVELIKADDRYGFSIAMNNSGSILAVGAPYSDGQYFENYKGVWNSFQTYKKNDIVKRNSIYYKLLVDTSVNNQPPTSGWEIVANVSNDTSGKVFVYQRTTTGSYDLLQTLNIGSTSGLNTLEEGDLFGYDITIDGTGNTLVISSPLANIDFADRGSVFVFSRNAVTGLYDYVQKLESFEGTNNENFGNAICISKDSTKIAVGAYNGFSKKLTGFVDNTTFDDSNTTFSDPMGFTGNVYVFERKDTVYVLAEKLEADFQDFESFGSSVACSTNFVVTGSKNYRVDNVPIGKLRFFNKPENITPWKTIASQELSININLIAGAYLFDPTTNTKISDLDIVDHFKFKVLGIADQEISFKVPYDPAIYMRGTNNQIIDPSQSWFEKNVGKVWWDIGTAKWLWYEQGDTSYRVGNWNQLAVGSTIDVYEWVETDLLPSQWAEIADTPEGISEGISGQPLYPDDTVYNTKENFNPNNGALTDVKYYYWVKNSTVVPNAAGRKIPAAEVAALIVNPLISGHPLLALIDTNKFLAYNFDSIIPGDTALLNIEYLKTTDKLKNIHSEYQLLSETKKNQIINSDLETKWLDSLIGFDSVGNQVPDPNLPAKQKYGIKFRPRQSMFVDRSKALRIIVDKINNVFKTAPFAENSDISGLLETDPVPEEALNLYDQVVDTNIDLENVGTARLRQAILRVNIVDGELDTVDIIDAGFGYKPKELVNESITSEFKGPPVVIQGTGIGGKIETVIDNQGRIIRATVVQRGKRYTTASLSVRPYSVLVVNDVNANNFWTIYSWDQKSREFYRSNTQRFNTRNYWDYIDWWAEGFSSNNKIVKEIPELFLENQLSIKEGDLLRVKEYGSGGWVVLERINTFGEILNKYRIVGREKGTIQFKNTLYDANVGKVGYDNVGSYDNVPYDQQPITELRNIFNSIKNDIFVGDLRVQWNNLFFASIGYVFSEQLYVGWAFKTSFLSAIHNVGELEQKTNFKNDNLESFVEYLNEIKPYRSKIRDYTSAYNKFETANTAVTDFDNPTFYSNEEDKVVSLREDSNLVNVYPWKWWIDNRGYKVVEIKIFDSGTNYRTPPAVVFESKTGSGAKAQAYISNGRVSAIRVTDSGEGYLEAPKVYLVGGNGATKPATAYAILGAGSVRNIHVGLKFDRISKDGIYKDLIQDESFIAPGKVSVFNLSYAPTRDKSKISIFKNNELVLSSDYKIDLYISDNDSYSLLRGKITFATSPNNGDTIRVVYEKNEALLDATNRITKSYKPTSGMLGFTTETITQALKAAAFDSQAIEVTSAKDLKVGMRMSGIGVVACRILQISSKTHITVSKPQTLSAGTTLIFESTTPSQLMTGIDFGGVQIQGNPFDVTGGWDALPWFTDNWDSVESNSDFYYVVESTVYNSAVVYKEGAIVRYNNNLYRATDKNSNKLPTNTAFWEPFTYITLSTAPANGQLISVYIETENNGIKRSVRVDDPYYDVYDGSTLQPNGQTEPLARVKMKSFVGDGINKNVTLPSTLWKDSNNNIIDITVILRSSDSDGTVNIRDINIIDTNLSGGTLETMRGAYQTATGKTAEEIIVDGEKFISPDQVPSPEENIPGQVLESVSIKVFHTKTSGSPAVLAKVVEVFTPRTEYEIGQRVLEFSSVIVYVDKVKNLLNVDYTIDFVRNRVIFNTAPSIGATVEIISIGAGGLGILDYQDFAPNGTDRFFLTNANFFATTSVLVTVDGNFVDAGFTNSRAAINNNADRTLVELAVPPAEGSAVKIITLQSALDTDTNQEPVVRINQQTFSVRAGIRSYLLDNFVNLGRSSERGSIIVELNGKYLRSPDTSYFVYDGKVNTITLGKDPVRDPGTLAISDIIVYKNDRVINYITDWSFDGTKNVLTLVKEKLTVGDRIRIEQNIDFDYNIINGEVILSNSVPAIEGQELTVTWFNEYPSVDLLKEIYSGGQLEYVLSRKPLDVSFLWVYYNGDRLTQDVDYYLNKEGTAARLNFETSVNDRIEIVQFGTDQYRPPVAYEIFKDMLNVNRYSRYSVTDLVLEKQLNYFDTTITVNNGDLVAAPNPITKVPGIVEINGEKIQYFTKTGNVLGQLRRGVLGTPIAEIHAVGSVVVDIGVQEVVPYTDTQEKIDFISDGSTIEIGPLDFTPKKSDKSFYRITVPVKNSNGEIINTLYPSIPLAYGQCDEVEVFVGGRRLNKTSAVVYDETEGSTSPDADVTIEAEFSVDGTDPYIRLTEPVPAGIRITILRKTGKVWYERGETTASAGISMLDNETPIIKFIEQKTTKSI